MLSYLIHRNINPIFSRKICVKLKELIPRQQFDIACSISQLDLKLLVEKL